MIIYAQKNNKIYKLKWTKIIRRNIRKNTQVDKSDGVHDQKKKNHKTQRQNSQSKTKRKKWK